MLRQQRHRLSGAIVFTSLALLAAACNPGAPTATPTPTALIVLTAATMPVTLVPTEPPPAATATPTEEVAPDPGDQVTQVVATGTVVATELDACALLTDEEAAAVLGAAPLSKTPGVDEDQGLVLNFCTYLGNGQALVVSVADAGSETAARDYIESSSQVLEPDATATKEGDVDLGPDVYWMTTAHAAGYNVAYGPHAFSVTLGGQVTPTDDLKAQLLQLTKTVGGRLGG
jgi:hypothetical protein